MDGLDFLSCCVRKKRHQFQNYLNILTVFHQLYERMDTLIYNFKVTLSVEESIATYYRLRICFPPISYMYAVPFFNYYNVIKSRRDFKLPNRLCVFNVTFFFIIHTSDTINIGVFVGQNSTILILTVNNLVSTLIASMYRVWKRQLDIDQLNKIFYCPS